MSTRIRLPDWWVQAVLPHEELLWRRRPVRAFTSEALPLQHCAQLLWAAQGISDPIGLRTAPSAGARYPLEVLLVVGQVTGLDTGIYRYEPAGQALTAHMGGDQRAALAKAAQNVCLECTALGLGTVPVGAFDDDAVKRVLRLPAEFEPLYLLPVGYAA